MVGRLGLEPRADLGQAARVVQGTVQNGNDQPQANAVVYLQDQTSRSGLLSLRPTDTTASGN